MAEEFFSRLNKYIYLVRSYINFIITGKALDFPLKLQIQTNSSCNGRCLFCPYPKISNRLEQGVMEKALFEKISNELLFSRYPKTIEFELQNEPLLDERTFEFVKYIKTHNKRIECYLTTNGQLLNRFSVQEIQKSEIDRLIISLNAHTRETYQKISFGFDYENIIRNIIDLASENGLKRKISISFVLTQDSAQEVLKAVQYWRSKGIETMILELSNRAGALADYESMRLEKNSIRQNLPKRIGRYLITRIIDILGCPYPFYHINILFNGDVILCFQDWNRVSVIGNVKDKSIKEVWNSPKMNQVRALLLKKQYSQINCCTFCSEVR